MDYPKIIDSHSHIYPKSIAEKAILNIGEFYNVPMQNLRGTSDDLIESGKKINVEKYIVHSIATAVSQVQSINNFIASEASLHSEFVGYCTLHPDMTEEAIVAELERIKTLNLKGIKLHADFQRFDIDDIRAEKIYRNVDESLPILFHAGDDRFDYSSPERLAKMARKYPKITCVAAHFGGYCRWSEIDCYDGLDNVFFDTSSSLFKLPDLMAKAILRHIGYEKFMFGCDFPMWNHTEELKRFLNLGFSQQQNEDILYYNAKRILKI